jgi:hypothetical protein
MTWHQAAVPHLHDQAHQPSHCSCCKEEEHAGCKLGVHVLQVDQKVDSGVASVQDD